MSGANARNDRRRRMLHEEARSASPEAASDPVASRETDGSEGRRYALVEGSLGEVLARRLFPQHLMAPVGAALVSLVTVGSLVALDAYRTTIDSTLGTAVSSLFELTSPRSLANWLAVAAWLAAAVFATLIFVVRRQRVDDYRGRHRLWRTAAVVCVLLSIDTATQLHTLAAAAISSVLGFRLLAGGAEWSLAAGLVVLGWVGARVLLDIKESRLALASYLTALASYIVALVCYTFLSGSLAATAAPATLLIGHLMVIVGLVAYARFLRRDVQQGVATRPQKSRTGDGKSSPSPALKRFEPQPATAANGSTAAGKKSRVPQPAPATLSTTQWTDGSDGARDEYDDEPATRKLSKSERKRLRREKAERRAA